MEITRDFTATTFVVADGRTLLLRHRKLGAWFPPGGHIDPHELPHEAAIREVREESGLEVALVATSRLIGAIPALPQPYCILLEDIGPGHQHIDLIYFAHVTGGQLDPSAREIEDARWLDWAALDAPDIHADIRELGRRAIEMVSAADPQPAPAQPTLRVALAQIDIALGDPEANLATVAQMATRAAQAGAGLLVLPELWSTGYDLGRAGELATGLDDGIPAAVAGLARAHRLAICGSTLVRGADRPTNTATLFDADGVLRATYSKLHLFGLMNEPDYLAGGETAPVVDMPWGRTALAICYDLRFPELFRSYALRGAGVILLPSEWPHPRLEHWRTLVRARAIEDQCFVLACNRVGRDRTSQFCGHSLVVDPWGSILAEGDEEPGLLVADLDLTLVAQVRGRMTTLRDRRPEMYT